MGGVIVSGVGARACLLGRWGGVTPLLYSLRAHSRGGIHSQGALWMPGSGRQQQRQRRLTRAPHRGWRG